MSDQLIQSHIKRLPLFARLSPEQLAAASGAFQESRCPPGERLYRQGEYSHGLYLFIAGGGRILQTGADGLERGLGDVRPGEYVGESSLFLNEPRDASLIVVQESVVLVLSKARFNALLDARPDILAVLSVRQDLLDSLLLQRQQGIRPDEGVLLTTRRHPWAFAGRILRGVVIFAVLLGLAIIANRAGLLVPLLPLLMLGLAVVVPAFLAAYYFFEWLNDYFQVTNQRIIHEERSLLTLHQNREQALLNNVQNVNVRRRGWLAEIIGFGDVIVSTASSQPPMILDMIPAPFRAQQVILDQLAKQPRPPGFEWRDPVGGQIGSALRSLPLPGGFFAQIFRTIFPGMRVVEGDQIIYRKHWIVLLGALWKPVMFYGLLGVLLAIWLFGTLPFLQNLPGTALIGVTLVWMTLNTFWCYWGYADWRDDLYILDPRFVTDIKRRPFWLQEVRIQAGLLQVQNVTSRIASFWGHLFNVGDVIIQTAAEQGTMKFSTVHRPQQVAEEILLQVQRRAGWQSNASQEDQRKLIAEYLESIPAQRIAVPPKPPAMPEPTQITRPIPPARIITEHQPNVPKNAPAPSLDETQARAADFPARPPSIPL